MLCYLFMGKKSESQNLWSLSMWKSLEAIQCQKAKAKGQQQSINYWMKYNRIKTAENQLIQAFRVIVHPQQHRQ